MDGVLVTYDTVVVSPREDLAAVRWSQTYNDGVVLVSVTPDGLEQVPVTSLRDRWNAVHGPAFSPDGRYLVLSCGDWRVSYEDEGTCGLGWICIYDTRDDSTREIAVEEELLTKWDVSSWEAWLGEPRFVTHDQFVVRLPSGVERRFTVA
jgi:hypothetical protein